MNQYPGYCIDCGRDVKRGHGELKKRGGKYVVSCGRGATAKAPTAPAPKPERPGGMRIGDMRITSSNASLAVGFAVNGIGYAKAFEPFQTATGIKYKRHSPWTAELEKYAVRDGETVADAQIRYEADAAKHAIAVEANEALHAALKAQGQITYESQHEFTFSLSVEEEAACVKLIADAKGAMLAAILDATGKVQVQTVGCDFPHPQICEIALADGTTYDYALTQNLLRDFGLKVDGRDECKDLAAAIRAKQAKIAENDATKAEHKRKRAAGYHLVAIKQCWECGRTKILGEFDDDFHVVRMPESVYSACVAEQRKGHERSLATVPAGTMLSSVGFDPDPASTFEFRCIENDWYCGC